MVRSVSKHKLAWLAATLMACLLIVGCDVFLADGSSADQQRRKKLSEEAAALRNQGKSLREKSLFSEALPIQNEALGMAILSGDTIEMALNYNQLGTTFRRMGRMAEALEYHYAALRITELSGDTSYQARKNRVVSLNGLGNISLSLSDEDEAESYFRQALAGEISLGSQLGQAINYANIGSIFEQRNELDSARLYYQRSMALNESIGNQLGIGLCHSYFGHLAECMGDVNLAILEYQTSYEILQATDDDWHELEPLIQLARCMLENGYPEAKATLDKAEQIARSIGSIEHQQEISSLMALYYSKNGDLSSAIDQYKLCIAYRDSLSDPSEEHRMREAYIEYERQKVRNEISTMRQAYESEQTLYRWSSVLFIILLVALVVVLSILVYANRMRKQRHEALTSIESMRTTFFRNITHEFRTPLTVILGLADQLKDETLSEPTRVHYLRSIEKQGKSLLDLVNQLLSLSKLIAGYGQGEWRHGDALSFIRMTIAGYSDFAQMHNVQLNVSTTLNEVQMDFVPEYFNRIIRNLLSNSFKYTPVGGQITLTVDIREGHLVLDVRDTGCGIPPNEVPHVFELFHKGTDTPQQGSIGIGLPFVYQMVRQMGGVVSVSETSSHGTTIHLVIPLRRALSGEQIRPWSLEDELKATPSPRPEELQNIANLPEQMPDEKSNVPIPPLVMIVEDNRDVAEYIHMLLNIHYRVITATDGYDALHKAEQQLPDLIITDLMMPGMDGYALCHMVRQSQVMADVPIVVVSARSEDDDRVRVIEEGADAFLLKPFNANELLAIVSRLLSQRRQQQQHLRDLISNSAEASSSDDVQLTQADREYLDRLHNVVIQDMAGGDISVDGIASSMATSRSVLNRHIRQLTGTSAAAYVLQIRMQHARQLLLDSNDSVGEISLACGFDDMSYFSRVFRQTFGATPSQFRNENNRSHRN